MIKDWAWSIYGLAGTVSARLAKINLWWTFPLIVFVLMILGMATLVGLGGAVMYANESDTPERKTIGALSEGYSGPKHVQIMGVPDRNVALQISHKRNKYAETPRILVAVIDKSSGGAIMVQLDGDFMHATGDDKPRPFEGMLEYAGPELTTNVPDSVAGLPLNHKYYLQEGATPGNSGVYGLLGVGSGLLFVPLALAWMNQSVIFRKRSQATRSRALNRAAHYYHRLPMIATGKFKLEDRASKFCLNMPVVLGSDEQGNLALVANEDQPNTLDTLFVPATSHHRSGLWCIVFDPLNVTSIDVGEQYIGSKAYPAIRVNISRSIPRMKFIISVNDSASRDNLANYILSLPLEEEVGEQVDWVV